MGQPETTFGATIVHAPTPDTTKHTHAALMPTTTDYASPVLTPAVTNDSFTPSYAERPIPPCSPFYQHPPASHERVSKPQSLYKSHLDVGVAEKGISHDDLTPVSVYKKNPFCSTLSVDANQECTMWPSRQTLATNKLSDKKKQRSSRFCACAGLRHQWEQLDKSQRILIQVAVALVLVGAMIGLGVGISKAVHGSYYSGSGNSLST